MGVYKENSKLAERLNKSIDSVKVTIKKQNLKEKTEQGVLLQGKVTYIGIITTLVGLVLDLTVEEAQTIAEAIILIGLAISSYGKSRQENVAYKKMS